MTRRRGMRGGMAVLVAILTMACFLSGSVAPAADAANKLAGLDTSLRLVPDSAAFYSSMLRGREQVDAILQSRAFAKLKQLPTVQMGLAFYQMQASAPDSVPGKIQKALEDPQVKELLALLADMFSQEVFFYGDMSTIDLLELTQQIQRSGQIGQLVNKDSTKAPGQAMLRILSQNANRVKAPSLLAGFKLSNRQRAVEQLAKLELILGILLQQNPKTQQAMKRTKVAGHEYLVVTLTGAMIPWDQVPLDDLKNQVEKPADVDALVAQLKKQKLAIVIGLRENYLIFAVGPSTDVVAALGGGKRLVDRPEWKRIDPHVGKRLTGLTYLSQEVRQRLMSNQLSLDSLVQQVEQVLPATGVKPEQQKRIAKDVKSFATDLKSYMPKLGSAVNVGYLTPTGAETYGYQWDVYGALDATRPLTLLEHLGGSPLLAIVGRGKSSVANYDTVVKWLGVAWRYAEEFGTAKMDKEEQQQFKKFVEQARPLLKRIDAANRTQLIPALADGQMGLVLDAKLKSKHFLRDLPATENPMPMVEPALIYGVSDPALLRKGAAEYAACLKALLKIIDDLSPSPEPVLVLPPLKVTKTDAGEVAHYPLPAEWGVDRQVALSFGLNDKVAVVTTSPAMAQRLLKATPLKVGGVLADIKRPRGTAIVLRWAAIVEAATPWVEFGLQQAGESLGEQRDAIASQVRTVLDVLKVFRSATSERYIEAGVIVEHAQAEYCDVP